MEETFVKVTARGRVTRQPVLRSMPDGEPVTTIAIEIEKANGDMIYHDWEIFGDKATAAANLVRGSLVELEGTEVKKQWPDKVSGAMRTKIIKRARSITFFQNVPPTSISVRKWGGQE